MNLVQYTLFFELLRVALGNLDSLSKTVSEQEWLYLYKIAERQALLGISFYGVSRIELQEQKLPVDLYYDWLATATQIQSQNEKLDQQTIAIWNRLKESGFASIILKGQGNATMYGPMSSLRQSGDIDVWIQGNRKCILGWVSRIAPTNKITWLHAHLHFFKDTEVEVHFVPTYLRNPLYNYRLQKWFNQNGWSNTKTVQIGGGEISIPNDEFNIVFQLLHIFRHLFGEGIGLRQVMDYYFLLLTRNQENIENKNEKVMAILRQVGLTQFASGMMWILGYVFHLEQELMICGRDEKLGRMILDDIMKSGNFGHQDERKRNGESRVDTFLRVNRENIRYIRYFPTEVICTPFYRIWHRCWKWSHGYQ